MMKNQNAQSSTDLSRRSFIKASTLSALGTSLWPSSTLGSEEPSEQQLNTYRAKAMGCFMGAAIADAMGGPVECQHYKRIAKYFPDFQNHLSYNMPPATFMKLKPGYALDEAPGSITDDTFIRMDLSRYVLQNEPPYTAASFASWLVEHADFSNWWGQAVKAVRRVENGSVTPEEGGKHHKQGGGGAWWQPIAILHAGDPKRASAVTADMCRIWKAPLEQDILSSVVAGQAAAFKKNATLDSVVDAVVDDSGPLARKLFTCAIDIAAKARSSVELYENIYEHCLVESCTMAVDGPMPTRLAPIDKMEGGYNGILFAEQQPLALAYFVYGQGDPRKTVLTAVKGGRDADSITCNSAAWLGALKGIPVWPPKWVCTVQQANLKRMNLEQTGQALIAKGIKNGTVRFDRM